MRIGIFSDIYKPSVSGVVTVIDDMKKILEEKGHKVFIITVNTFQDERKNKYLIEDNVIRIPGIPTGIYDYRLMVTYPVRAVKLIKSLNLDIIHTQTEFSICRFGKSMAKKLNIPVVHTYHTLYEACVSYVTKGYINNIGQKAIIKYVKNYMNDAINQIIVPSKTVSNIFKNKYKLEKDVHVIPSGIDLSLFDAKNYKKDEIKKLRKELNFSNKDVIFSYIGRLGEEKCIDFIIKNSSDILKNNKNVKLLIVGGGPEEDNLRSLAEKYNILDKVIFTGKVSHDEVGLYYQVIDLFITASNLETQGLTVMEALAASKPVIVLNIDVFSKVIMNGYNGLIFNNEEEFKSILEELINNPEKIKVMSENAYKSSLDYSLDVFANRLLKVYNKALKDKMVNNNK